MRPQHRGGQRIPYPQPRPSRWSAYPSTLFSPKGEPDRRYPCVGSCLPTGRRVYWNMRYARMVSAAVRAARTTAPSSAILVRHTRIAVAPSERIATGSSASAWKPRDNSRIAEGPRKNPRGSGHIRLSIVRAGHDLIHGGPDCQRRHGKRGRLQHPEGREHELQSRPRRVHGRCRSRNILRRRRRREQGESPQQSCGFPVGGHGAKLPDASGIGP